MISCRKTGNRYPDGVGRWLTLRQYNGKPEPKDFSLLVRSSTGKIGAGKLLKVKAGQKIHTTVQYNYEGTVTSNTTHGLNTLAAGLSMLLNGAATVADPAHGLGSSVSAAVGADPAAAGFFASQNNQSTSTKPRAYLNVLFFDKNFKFDSVSSYSKQIGADGNPGQIVLAKQAARRARKDGYAYVYISNESNDPPGARLFVFWRMASGLCRTVTYLAVKAGNHF